MPVVKYAGVTVYDFQGMQTKALTPPGLESASLDEVSLEPGVEVSGLQPSPNDKLFVCIAGEISFRIGKRQVRLEPRDVLHISKGEPFTFENRTAGLATALVFQMPRLTPAAGGVQFGV